MHIAGRTQSTSFTRTWILLTLCLLGGLAGHAAPARPGQPDPNYRPRFEATGGQFQLHPTAGSAYLVELAPEDVRLNFGEVRRLARIQPDGTLDARFVSPAFLTNAYFSQVLPQPDGSTWIEYSPGNSVYPRTPVRFLRLRADGTRDESFHLPARADDEDWHLLAIQWDGKVLVAVKRPNTALAERHQLQRLQPDGSMDASFHSAVDEGAFIQGADVLPDGRIVAQFTPTAWGESFVSAWMRLRPDGSRDDTFNPPSEPNYARDSFSAVSPGGEILIVRYGTDPILIGGGPGAKPLVRLRADGSPDPDFHSNYAPDGFLGFLPDGHVRIQVNAPATGAASALELDHDGALVAAFTPDITPQLYQPLSILPLPNSRYLVQDGHQAWLYSSQGARLSTFNLVVHQVVKPPVPVAYPDGSLFFGHRGFVAVNRTAVSGPALIDAAGKLDPRFTAWFQGQANWLPVQGANGEIYVGDPTTGLFTAVSRDGSLRQLGSRGNGFAPDSVRRLQFQSDLSLVVAGSESFQRIRSDAHTESGPAIADADGLRGFTLLPDDSALVWGPSAAFAGMPGNGIGRLRSDLRRPVPGFRPALPAGASGLVAQIQADGKVLAAYNPHLRIQPNRSQLVRLNADGSQDPQFKQRLVFDGLVKAIQLDSQGRILVAGGFHTMNGTARNGVARLLQDGTPDESFGVGDGPDAAVENLFVLPGDDVVLHGDFRHFNGEECWGLVKLSAGAAVTSAPRITSLTPPLTVHSGDSATLGAIVTGGAPLRAQWFLDGIVLPGETNATLTLRQVDEHSPGNYSLFVENGEGADVASTSLAVQPPVAELPSLAFMGTTPSVPPRLNVGLVAEPTNRFRLQVSTNLTVWRPVAGILDPNTSLQFTDPFGSQPGPRFIRALPQ